MIVEASLPGLFRMLLIIVGAIFLVRFLMQLMNAKSNMEQERDLNAQKRAFEEEKAKKYRKFGKTSILDKSTKNDVEDVDFEEVE